MTVGTLTNRVTVDDPVDEFDLDVRISVLPDVDAPTAHQSYWQSCQGTCGNYTCAFCGPSATSTVPCC